MSDIRLHGPGRPCLILTVIQITPLISYAYAVNAVLHKSSMGVAGRSVKVAEVYRRSASLVPLYHYQDTSVHSI
jgi:hypothetical protein